MRKNGIQCKKVCEGTNKKEPQTSQNNSDDLEEGSAQRLKENTMTDQKTCEEEGTYVQRLKESTMTDQKTNNILKKDPGENCQRDHKTTINENSTQVVDSKAFNKGSGDDSKPITEQTDGRIDDEGNDKGYNHQKENRNQVSSRNNNELKEVAQKDPTNDQVEAVEKRKDISEV